MNKYDDLFDATASSSTRARWTSRRLRARKKVYVGLDIIFAAIWEDLANYRDWTVLLLNEIDHTRHDTNCDHNASRGGVCDQRVGARLAELLEVLGGLYRRPGSAECRDHLVRNARLCLGLTDHDVQQCFIQADQAECLGARSGGHTNPFK